jgi:PAS domain S-box-containing protein
MDEAAAAAEIGSWEWDLRRDEIWATNGFRALFGIPTEQRIAFEGVMGLVHPDDRNALRDAVTESLEKRVLLDREYRVASPEGAWRWILTRGRVEAGASGKPTLLHGVSINVTRRKLIEDHFQRVVEVAPFGIVILRETRRIDLVNPWVETTFGYSYQELVRQSIQTLVPGLNLLTDDDYRYGAPASLLSRRMVSQEVAGRRKDGTKVPLEIDVNVLQALHGSSVELLLTMIDISERKRNEDSLKEERAFLRQVIDTDPNLVFAKDRQGRYTLANRATADIYGTTVHGLVGRRDADFNSNVEEVAFSRRVELEVMDGLQERVVPEEQLTDAAGRIHSLQTVKRPIVGPDGRADQILGTATDITARKAAEDSIRHSEAFNRAVLASLQDHVVILDQSGTIVAVNDALNEFDLRDGGPWTSGARGIGRSYMDVCAYGVGSGAETARRAREGINAVLVGECNFFSMEYKCKSRTDSGWVLMRVQPLTRMEGGVVISHSDITQRKAAEFELERQRHELAHFSRVTMLGQLSGSLAHELNQPLAAILSNAQAGLRFLDHEDLDRDEVRDILRDIVSDNRRAGEVIQGLRLLLRKGETRPEPLDMNELVQDVFRLMRNDILNARIDVTMELGASLPTVTGNRVQLVQVLLNLVMNGCDAMSTAPASDRHLVVTSERVAGDDVRVCVSDRGAGIPPRDLERVFEPFYTTKVSGLGLGLLVSRKIIAAHGGILYAGNNAAGGADFCLTVPSSAGGA